MSKKQSWWNPPAVIWTALPFWKKALIWVIAVAVGVTTIFWITALAASQEADAQALPGETAIPTFEGEVKPRIPGIPLTWLRTGAYGEWLEGPLGTNLIRGTVKGNIHIAYRDQDRAYLLIPSDAHTDVDATTAGSGLGWSGRLIDKTRGCVSHDGQGRCVAYAWTARFRFNRGFGPVTQAKTSKVRVRCRANARCYGRTWFNDG